MHDTCTEASTFCGTDELPEQKPAALNTCSNSSSIPHPNNKPLIETMAASTMDTSSCAGTLNHEEMDITLASPSGGDIRHVSKRQKVAHPHTPFPTRYDTDADEFEEISLDSDDESDSDEFEEISLESDDESESDSVYEIPDSDDDSGLHYTDAELGALGLEQLTRQVAHDPTCDISTRSYVSNSDSEAIRFSHVTSLCALWEESNHDLHLSYEGASPSSSYSPSACSTPTTEGSDCSDELFDDFDGVWIDDEQVSDDHIEQLMEEIAEPRCWEGSFGSLSEALMADVVPPPADKPASPKSYHAGIFAQLKADFARRNGSSDDFALSESSGPEPSGLFILPRSDYSHCRPQRSQTSNQHTSTGEAFIDPYGLPDDAPECNVPENIIHDHWVKRALRHSGVNCLIDYPLSESPRLPKSEIRQILLRFDPFNIQWGHAEYLLEWPYDAISIKVGKPLFTPFSYTNADQPRTRIARLMEGEPISPRTKVPAAIMRV